MNTKHLVLCLGLFSAAVVLGENETPNIAEAQPEIAEVEQQVQENPVLTLEQAEAIIKAQTNTIVQKEASIKYEYCKTEGDLERYVLAQSSKETCN